MFNPERYEDREMTLTEHLEALRRCLIISLLVIFVGTAVVWNWSGDFLAWLARPVGGLIFLAPTEAFFTRFKVAAFGGLLLSLPVVLHQVWTFTACAIGKDLRKGVLIILPASYFLFLAGVSLAVFFVIPNAVHFLMAYGSDQVQPLFAVGAYLEFVTLLALAFGLVFQIPLVLLFLHRAGIITYEMLAAKRRYIYFAGVVAAAMLTPGPDVVSQIALAVPTIILFEITLLIMRCARTSG
ncbi:MAG: twin-arginine translocase subunit TatC [Elusimicrobiota bacterium]